MYLSGLMVLEVYATVDNKSNLLNLLETVLGKSGKGLGLFLFFFLFCSLLTAYLNGFSSITKSSLDSLLNIQIPKNTLLVIVSVFLLVLINSKTRKIELINRISVFAMLIFYGLLVFFGTSQIKTSNLTYIALDAKTIALTIPIFVVSFGFQNLIPLISQYLNHNYWNVKKTLFLGTTITLCVYLVWNYIILGMLSPMNEPPSIHHLFANAGNPAAICINGFAFLAITTSVITVAISFIDFVSKAADRKIQKWLRSAYVIFIPTLFAIMNPDIFLKALHIAGGIAAVGLFGLMPCWMLWKIRYIQQASGPKLFPFGKPVIFTHILSSILVMTVEITHVLTPL